MQWCMVALDFRMRCPEVAVVVFLLTTQVAPEVGDDYYSCYLMYDPARSLLDLRPVIFDAADITRSRLLFQSLLR